jgi:proline dehydrogenase
MPLTNFLKNNTIWVISMLCAAAVTYYKVDQSELELIKVEERLNKKIKIISKHEEEIQELQIRIAVLETTECK